MATKSKHVAALEAQLDSPDEHIRHAAAMELSRMDRNRQIRADKRRPSDAALDPLRKALETASSLLEQERQRTAELEARLLVAELAEKSPVDAVSHAIQPLQRVPEPAPVPEVPQIVLAPSEEDWAVKFNQQHAAAADLQRRSNAAADWCDTFAEIQAHEQAERGRLISVIEQGRAREANSMTAWKPGQREPGWKPGGKQ